MLILMPYVDKRTYCQTETISFYNSIKYKYNIIRKETPNPIDYYNLLLDNWNIEDILIWEMDLVPTEINISELYVCKYDICTYNYKLTNGNSICRNKDRTPFLDNAKFSDRVGFGFTKISLKMQKIINPTQFKRNNWETLDTEFSHRMEELKYQGHVHWPIIKHNHNSGDR